MKYLYITVVLAAVWLVQPVAGANPSKKGQKDVTTCYILHTDDGYDSRIQSVQDSLASISGGDSRFLGGLVSLACNFIAGKIVSTAQNAATSAMDRSKAKFSAEWGIAAKKDYFYNNISTNGYMDLKGMNFDGFKVVRAVPNEDQTKIDTAFYLSCHLDRSKMTDLVKNSTFSLVLDTLRIDLSKTKAKLPQNRDFKLDVTIRILASWATQSATYYKDQELGSFQISLNIPKNQTSDVYVCTRNVITGRSFVIPRSYSGSVSKQIGPGQRRTIHLWGQGEYTIDVSVKEQTEDRGKMRDLLYEYLQEVNKYAGTSATGYIQQYTTFDNAKGAAATSPVKK